MPAPARTGRAQIVGIGRDLLEQGGADAVTMVAVAERVGVRAPSLYKHVRDRGDLLGAVVADAVRDLAERLAAAADDRDPRRSILEQLRAMRRFAIECPHGFRVILGSSPDVPRPDQTALERGLDPLLAALTTLLGPERALDGARFLVAWANGSLTMETNGQLRMGGDVSAAWDWGLHRAVAVIADAGRT